MKVFKKVILVVVAVALYLNAGWALGTYYHNHVLYQSPQTVIQIIAKGGWEFFTGTNCSLIKDQIVFMFCWPLLMIALVITWMVYLVVYLAYQLLWLWFAGGIAKLLAVG